MAAPTAQTQITDQQKQHFQDEGYFILESAIDRPMLSMLREECSYFIGYTDAEMDFKQEETRGIQHRRKRYFIGNRYRQSHRLHRFLFSPLMAEVTQAALGPNVYLFLEQWVVKGPEQGMKFSWHQDSGYLKAGDVETQHKPYLTCWIPVDDVDENNGTVYILPYSRAPQTREIIDHNREEQTNDLVGYTGDDPGIPVEVPAGSIVAFSSYMLHRSGANTSPDYRRVYVVQYSAEPILNSKTGDPWLLAVPFVKDGKIVYDAEKDLAESDVASAAGY